MKIFPNDSHVTFKIPRAFVIGFGLLVAGSAFGAGGAVLYGHITGEAHPVLSTSNGVTTTNAVVTSTSSQTSQTQKSNTSGLSFIKNIFSPHSTVPQPVVQSTTTSAPPSASQTSTQSVLVISNVHAVVQGNTATITWNTSLPARSQLLLNTGAGIDNGNATGYESVNGIGVEHRVDFKYVVDNTYYGFKIVAHTVDGKLNDDYYGSFTGEKHYVAYLGERNDSNVCRPVIVKDTSGHPAKDVSLTLSGSYSSINGGYTSYVQSQTIKTDADGLVISWQGCENANYAEKTNLKVQ